MSNNQNKKINTNENAGSFQFKDKTFDFPIGVYWHLPKKLWIIFGIIGFMLLIMMTLGALKGDLFTALFGFIVIALFLAMLFFIKKPRFVLYDDKMVFDEHGTTKPKILPYTHAKLYAYERNHNGIMLHFVDFLYQDNNGQLSKIATINLEQARFDTHHFDKNDTLQFFEKIKTLHKQV